MTEKLKMTIDIHNFVWGNMDWDSAIDLIGKVSKSDQWIDYLLMEMELYEYFKNCEKCTAQFTDIEMESYNAQ